MLHESSPSSEKDRLARPCSPVRRLSWSVIAGSEALLGALAVLPRYERERFAGPPVTGVRLIAPVESERSRCRRVLHASARRSAPVKGFVCLDISSNPVARLSLAAPRPGSSSPSAACGRIVTLFVDAQLLPIHAPQPSPPTTADDLSAAVFPGRRPPFRWQAVDARLPGQARATECDLLGEQRSLRLSLNDPVASLGLGASRASTLSTIVLYPGKVTI